MDTIEIRFALTPGDYARVTRSYYLHDRPAVVLLSVIAVMALLGLTAAISGVAAWGWSLGVIGLVVPLILFVMMPLQNAGLARRNERMLVETTWRFDEQGISAHTVHGDSTMDWGTLRRAVETRDYYLLVYAAGRSLFTVIPRRAFESPTHEKAFRDLLRRKIPRRR